MYVLFIYIYIYIPNRKPSATELCGSSGHLVAACCSPPPIGMDLTAIAGNHALLTDLLTYRS